MARMEPHFKKNRPQTAEDRQAKRLMERFEGNQKKRYDSLLMGAYLSTLSLYRKRMPKEERDQLARIMVANTLIFPDKEYQELARMAGMENPKGIHLPFAKASIFPESAFSKPRKVIATLKHEGIHFLRNHLKLWTGDEIAAFGFSEVARYRKMPGKKFYSSAAKEKKEAMKTQAPTEYYRTNKAFGHTVAIMAARLERTHGKGTAKRFLEKVVNEPYLDSAERWDLPLKIHPIAEMRAEAIRETAGKKTGQGRHHAFKKHSR